ncbi:lipopolysaccharide assembly outer membrane protein LptD (OstA) [Pedobacter sp. UYP30]|uniref:hypothetical protein n=1 Tax=Pedobacter sp. UYP30 TaxID=1756400 RepID=UPI0033943C52
MKNLLLLSLLLFGFNAFAQESTTSKKTPILSYKCNDSTSLSKDKTILKLFGDATIKTDALEITHADKIVFDSKTNEMIVTGKFEYRMRGALNIKNSSRNNTLRYKIGEDTAYID